MGKSCRKFVLKTREMAHKHSFGMPLAVLLLAGCAACVNAQAGAQTGTGAVSVTLAASPTDLNSTYNPNGDDHSDGYRVFEHWRRHAYGDGGLL